MEELTRAMTELQMSTHELYKAVLAELEQPHGIFCSGHSYSSMARSFQRMPSSTASRSFIVMDKELRQTLSLQHFLLQSLQLYRMVHLIATSLDVNIKLDGPFDLYGHRLRPGDSEEFREDFSSSDRPNQAPDLRPRDQLMEACILEEEAPDGADQTISEDGILHGAAAEICIDNERGVSADCGRAETDKSRGGGRRKLKKFVHQHKVEIAAIKMTLVMLILVGLCLNTAIWASFANLTIWAIVAAVFVSQIFVGGNRL